ncbi:DUF4159 domain-containing protein [Tautonia sociabilis]|uniref:DUF4159 domain-containing protein n=1 Tax=Tautonia sociabilis TaxID=2080755 RepID=A0A432MIQ5_9BACT|nr:DUF4159 domain-containing protein [Tautonia sociabilis]RUL87179.1 DUF4159 domain-containing protein [Tautonia sociabilis]
MSRRRRISVALLGLVAIVGGTALAQQWPSGGRGSGRGRFYEPGVLPGDRAGVPDWEVDERFPKDVFTFVRVQYDSYGGRGRWGGGWATDWPDSDLNFPYRLQQLTSLKVSPDSIVLRLTDEELFDHPFLYMIEPGALIFSEEEVAALRRYLLNGGFLMVDDFWGEAEYQNFYQQIKRVFPEFEPLELPADHEIFRIVYRLKEKPQVPSIHSWRRGSDITWERWDAREPHYKGIFDAKGRMMVIICHNTDLGDGWEREGEDPDYFREFSEKRSYPMGINIVTYAMTH